MLRKHEHSTPLRKIILFHLTLTCIDVSSWPVNSRRFCHLLVCQKTIRTVAFKVALIIGDNTGKDPWVKIPMLEKAPLRPDKTSLCLSLKSNQSEQISLLLTPCVRLLILVSVAIGYKCTCLATWVTGHLSSAPVDCPGLPMRSRKHRSATLW